MTQQEQQQEEEEEEEGGENVLSITYGFAVGKNTEQRIEANHFGGLTIE